ncbi:hypothetical protein Ndes2437B_g02160 [Nannochloris sp. 'desiccata']
MKLSETFLRPPALGRGHLSRSLAIKVRAAARQSPSKTSTKGSISCEERIVETVEVAALTAAAAAAGLALSRSLNHTAPTQIGQAPPQKRTAAVTDIALVPPGIKTNIEALWITGPIFIAVSARSIAARLARRRAEATPASQAMARLSAAETALNKQADSLSILTRQVDKVQIRTRLVSRDMRAQVKEVQALTETHGEALLGANDKLAQLENEIRGLEELVDAVQGIAAKQFRLLSSLVGQGASKAPGVGNTSKKSSHSGSDNKKKIKSRNKPVAAVVKGDRPLAAKQGEAGQEVSDSAKDEWGRAVMAQSLRNKKDEEEVKIGNDKSGAGAVVVAETPPATAISIDDKRQMKHHDDGSVSFSF